MTINYTTMIEFLHYVSFMYALVHEISSLLLGVVFYLINSNVDYLIQISLILKFNKHEYYSYGSGPSSIPISFIRSLASLFSFYISSSEESLF